MNPKFCRSEREVIGNWNELKAEYDIENDNILKVKGMNISEELKSSLTDELEHNKNEIKERMHNYIDSLK